jgi:hypothetical protein
MTPDNNRHHIVNTDQFTLVELRVFSFCLVEVTIGNPLPIVNPPPVWLRIFVS